ncbi:MAG: PQQ-like beta-propeller repeat protein [Sedimentisphaerales bacterium]|nr:PQQ-like beta-propeller repeat protein [Sedimentisphaerales bacterium]
MKVVKWYCVIMIFYLPVGASLASDWPHYLGPNFDLKPLAKKFSAKSATAVWNAKVKTGMCSVTIADGLIYTMGNDGTPEDEDRTKAKDFVYCLDAKTGKEKWNFNYNCQLEPRSHPGGPSSTPTIHEGKVYTLSKFGHIFCLDAKTGEKLWDASASNYKPRKAWWGFAGSPTVIGDVVIYNIGNKGLGLNKDTGGVVWKSENNVVAYATPKPLPANMFNRPAVAILTNEDFLVLDPTSGNCVATYDKEWQEKSNCNAITPYVYKDRIYLVHSNHGLACLSINGNKLKQDWLSEDARYPNEWFAFNTHVIYQGNTYYLTKDRNPGGTGLNCVDAKTGKRIWFNDKYDFGNLLGVDNKLIMLSEKGELIWGRLNDAGFEETYRRKILDGLCWSTPVLIENLLYVRNAQGDVVCYRLE